MSAEFKIGRLRFTWKGAWAPTTVYARDDVAQYQGKTYVCLIPNTSDATSFYNDLNKITGGGSTPYWNLIVDGKTWQGAWTGPNTVYSLGNIVIFGGVVYYCNTQHTSTTFAADSAKWTQYSESSMWKTNWSTGIVYGKNDVVKYGGIVYKCITNHTSADTIALGLEADQSKWIVVDSGNEYKGSWLANGSGFRYKLNDIVKNGPDLWISSSGHIATSTFDQTKWSLWMPGIQYSGTWSSGAIYQTGEAVLYGGYTYVSKTANNQANVPSVDTTNWAVLTQGFKVRNEWTIGTSYYIGDVVNRHGSTFSAVADSTGQDPSSITLATTYTAAGSSGTTFKVVSTTGVTVGMNIIGVGFTAGQAVVSVVNGTTLVLSAAPDGTLTDAQAITFVGVNYPYWKILVPGTLWTKTWAPGQTYTVGDIAVWQNGTYVCVQNNVGSYTINPTPQNPSTRPDTDTANAYWVFYVPHARKNALTTLGDIETYNNGAYAAIPIGTNQQVLRNTNGLPTWAKINSVNAVYYVSSTSGTDRADYGTTWDQPWKTIAYACNFVGAGTQFPNATTNINTNKTWITTELVGWVIYQKANNLNGFSSMYSFDQVKTVRDAGYIIDALVYDLSRGGNSQTVAATLAYFQYGSSNQFYNLEVKADVPYYLPILTQLQSLIISVVQGSAPSTSYQTQSSATASAGTISGFTFTASGTVTGTFVIGMVLTGAGIASGTTISSGSGTTWTVNNFQTVSTTSITGVTPIVTFVIGNGSEVTTVNSINALYSILVTALTNVSTLAVPAQNSGTTATIFVKTGDYPETLPISVPENVAINGDELRGVVVRPATTIITTCTTTATTNSLFTVASTTGIANQTPVQFVDPNILDGTIAYTPLGGIVAGKTYYAVGSTITPTQFSVTSTTGTYSSLIPTVISATGQGALFNVSAKADGKYTVTLNFGGSGYSPGDQLKIPASSVGAVTLTTAGAFITGISYTITSVGTTDYTLIGAASSTIGVVFTATGAGAGTGTANFNTNDITILVTGIGGVQPTGPLLTFTQVGSCILPLSNGTGYIPYNTHMAVYAGDCIKDMFRLRNGTGLRNMTLTGLLGTLGTADSNQIQRPTGGSYASLDPGNGPNDTSAWIFRRSPYVQNVTAFGNGATGLKIDGTLHNGGNKSIVCNDFTHILSDGIGIWCTGPGALTEAVSVFSYYGYAGYFAEAGGRIRATNGNTSYGTYGVIASGYDITETPATGIIFNQSSQVQANVQSAFGSNSQLLRLTYANAGSTYYTTTTNLLNQSNNYLGGSWTTDGNVTLNQTVVAPSGLSEGWTLTGTTTNTNANYVYQNVAIPAAGATYSNVSAVNISGSGTGATFNITVTSTGYLVTVNSGGNGYVASNQLYVAGGSLGGVNSVNDCIITVFSLSGSAILSVTASGTVPTGSALSYTLSAFVKKGSASSVDLFAIYSGSSTVSSSINYNFNTGVLTPGNSGGGFLPTQYGALNQQLSTTSPTAGWYRIWFAVNDTTGLNTQLQFRIYPGSYNAVAGQYTSFYGSQLELSKSTYTPSFYLEVTGTTKYTAYANYNITGAGTGVVTIGDEIRSNSIFQTRVVTNANGITGGSGYLTASNNAQSGNTQYIQLAQSDTNTNGNYTNMRVFILSGTGAAQYGYISYYNSSTKIAYVLKESFTPLAISSTTTSTNLFTLAAGASTTDTLYINQPVQFIPTYYSTAINSVNLSQTTVSAAIGGSTNTFTVASTVGLTANTAITFTVSGLNATTFGGVIQGYTYYIFAVLNSTTIQITAQIYGTVLALNAYTGSNPMTMNFSSNNSYLQGTTTNMVVNYPIQFTGTAIGGLSVGTVYYINDVVDVGNFTIAGQLVTISVTATTSGTNTMTVVSTSSLVPLNPIIFSAPVSGGVSDGQKYYISSIVNATSFTIAATLITLTATATQVTSNLITVPSTTGFVANNPIVFTGITFGNIEAERVYYILAVNNATTFTISQSPGGSAVGLQSATGQMTMRTCPASFALSTVGSITMAGTTTSKKTSVTLGTGSMNATFSTNLYGNVQLGQTYYVTAIDSLNKTFTVSTSLGGSSLGLATKTGSMNVAAVGWDHINIGTPPVANLDNSSAYYIEPKTTYDAPPFVETAAASVVNLSVGTPYVSMAYGDGAWIAVATGTQTAAVSTDGSSWSSITMPLSISWTDIAYGAGYWVAINSAVTGTNYAAVSKSAGAGWRTSAMPSADAWSSITYGNGIFVAIANGTNKVAYSTNFGTSWTSATLPAIASWTSIVYGNGRFVAISSGSNTLSVSGASGSAGTVTLTFSTQASNPYVIGQTIVVSGCSVNGFNGSFVVTGVTTSSVSYANVTTTSGNTGGTIVGNSLVAYSTNGSSWATSSLPDTTTWSDIAYGSNQFVVVSTASHTSAYSFNGTTWYSSNIPMSADRVIYGQGVFLAITAGTGIGYTSEGGTDWTIRAVTTNAYSAGQFGFASSTYNGYFATLSGGSIGSRIVAGCRAKSRPVVTSGVITAINEFEPGSGYTNALVAPAVTFTDPNVTTTAIVNSRVSNGVLSNPTFNNRGSGYSNTSTSVIVTGNGFADQYQTGLQIILNNLTRLPSPGDNLTIAGISQVFKVTSAYAVFNTAVPNLEANVSVSPEVSTANATANGTVVSIRSKYSQARLTGHDFLNIGYGDFINSNYPGFPAGGYVASQQNQTVEANFGRVFFTSTDQDGNFKVGNLFGVQQATGIITLSASQFGLTGLQTLSLGGISVGGSSVVVTQFSTDSAFTANSDNVISTQKAIKSYLTSRLSQGGANTFTGQLTAGTVVVGGPNLIRSSIPNGISGSVVRMPNVVRFQGQNGGVDGNIAALDFFKRSWNKRTN